MSALAWLESTPREGQEPIRAELSRLPFTIGRNDACDLTIESARISREHVRIEQEAGLYMVRDLGSTNGTFVNGVRIKESPLSDGDLLTVANFGLVFHLPKSGGRGQATQCFTSHESGPAAADTVSQSRKLVETVRVLQEVALHRAARNRALAIVETHNSQAIGYELGVGPFDGIVETAGDTRLQDGLDCPALLRAYRLGREVAVEQAWKHLGDVLMYVSARTREVNSSDLIDSLDRLKQRPSGEARLVLQVPCEMLADMARFRDLRDQLREIGVGMAVDRFAGPPSMLEGLRGDPPEYLKLAASVVQAASRSSEQGKQLSALVKAAAAIEIQVIACGVGSEVEWQVCKGLGIPLAQGDFASAAMPLDACNASK